MNKNERVIVNLFTIESFTSCRLKDVDKAINGAREFYQRHAEWYEQSLNEKPNTADYWQQRLEVCRNILKAGFKAVTWEEYLKLQRDKWLSKEPTEITKEDFENALEVLPPKKWIQNERYSMFFIGECTTMTFYGQYLHDKVSGKYYTALTDILDESTWLDKMLNL